MASVNASVLGVTRTGVSTLGAKVVKVRVKVLGVAKTGVSTLGA